METRKKKKGGNVEGKNKSWREEWTSREGNDRKWGKMRSVMKGKCYKKTNRNN